MALNQNPASQVTSLSLELPKKPIETTPILQGGLKVGGTIGSCGVRGMNPNEEIVPSVFGASIASKFLQIAGKS